jgi:hypothetical protein
MSFVLARSHATPCLGKDIGKNGKVLRLVNTRAMPLVCQLLTHLNGTHALIYPTVAVALTAIVLDGHLEGQLIWSMRCAPTSANHFFTGSAFLDGID